MTLLRPPVLIPLSVSVALGALGVAWSDWFLLAGGVGALAAAAWAATDPTNP